MVDNQTIPTISFKVQRLNATALSLLIPELAPLGVAYAAERQEPGGFNADHFFGVWRDLLTTGQADMFLTPRFSGALGATYWPNMVSGYPNCQVNFWFVTPEHRGLGLGRLLLDAVEVEAEKRGCTHVVHGHPSRSKALAARGYAPIEIGYRKSL